MTAIPRKVTVAAPTVLIADDDPNICSMLVYLLLREGYEVLSAHDGRAALELIRERTPDALLTDLRMPRMDGLELLRQAKRIRPDLPVAMLTGFPGNDSVVEAIDVIGFHTTYAVINANYDPESQTITSFSKWRGIGDAFSSGTWNFIDGHFVLTRFDVDASYDGERTPQTVYGR